MDDGYKRAPRSKEGEMNTAFEEMSAFNLLLRANLAACSFPDSPKRGCFTAHGQDVEAEQGAGPADERLCRHRDAEGQEKGVGRGSGRRKEERC